MSYMFYNCKSLKSIPNISEWNMDNVNDLTGIFQKCSSLISYPDISKWPVKDIRYNKNIFE